jgi:hypothetical protein
MILSSSCMHFDVLRRAAVRERKDGWMRALLEGSKARLLRHTGVTTDCSKLDYDFSCPVTVPIIVLKLAAS